MNGRKARGLRNEAAHYAKSFDTDYVDTHHGRTIRGKQKVTTKLLEGCHRAVYQKLKQSE